MCGVAGLFSGCAAATTCPVAALLPVTATPDDSPGYRSPFDGWYERASVRTAPRRQLGPDGPARHLFSPELVPLLNHPVTQALPEHHRSALVTRHTYRYLDFTAVLEQVVVNRTALALSRDSLGLHLPEAMRLDAHKIYCDEAYHALFSADLASQIRSATGVEPVDPAEPYFLRRLRTVVAEHEPRDRTLVDLMFVICSEMLISGTLSLARPGPDVEAAVYDAVRDHAQDEGRHHVYFAQLLRHLWGQLGRAERRTAALAVPALVEAFMAPDVDAARDELAHYGLDRDTIEQVVQEVHGPRSVLTTLAEAAGHLTRAFRDLGALDDDEVRSRFADAGMLGLELVGASSGRSEALTP